MTLPVLATRAAYSLANYGLLVGVGKISEVLVEERGFCYDLALSSNKYTLRLMLAFADPKRTLFGTGFPHVLTGSIE